MLNKNILASISFVAGAAIGSIATYFIVNKKAQEKINLETSETREYYAKLEKELKAEYEISKPSEEDVEEYEEKAAVYNTYAAEEAETNTSDLAKQVTPAVSKVDDPYVISPDEFGEFDDYEKIYLACCHDGYIVDENFEILDRNSLNDIGIAYNMDRFGEYEDDILHIRNDETKTDFEITRISDDYKTLTHGDGNEEKEDLEE